MISVITLKPKKILWYKIDEKISFAHYMPHLSIEKAEFFSCSLSHFSTSSPASLLIVSCNVPAC